MALPLEKKLDDQVVFERNSGYAEEIAGNFEIAERHYLRAWSIFPEPKFKWSGSQITLYNISDFYLGWKKFNKALEWASRVFKTEPLPGDGFPYVKLGEIYFEEGKFDSAYDNFKKAFLLAGKRSFDGEDKKYLDFYLRREKSAS